MLISYQVIKSEVRGPSHARIEEPEYEGSQVVVTREEDVDGEVYTGQRLLHGDRGYHLEDGPGGHHDDECQ